MGNDLADVVHRISTDHGRLSVRWYADAIKGDVRLVTKTDEVDGSGYCELELHKFEVVS